MKQKQAKFESFVWEFELSQLEKRFSVTDAFLNDEQAQEFHLERKYKNKTKFTDGSGLDHIEDSVQFLPDGVRVFRRQMVVVLRTYLEQIIKVFLINMFIGKPEKMAKYLLLEEFKGVQSLKELEKILGNNRITSLNELPQNAATRVMRGNYQKPSIRSRKFQKQK